MNILVADDDKVISAMVCGVLKDAGHTTVPAFDAIQAFMIAMKQAPNLIVLDINMPGGTGINVLKKLKGSSKTANVPVIVCSANTDPNLPAEVITLGAVRFIPKPIDPDVLLAAVSDALK